jgi:hypothetical protein
MKLPGKKFLFTVIYWIATLAANWVMKRFKKNQGIQQFFKNIFNR